nr:UvrB/UvrC motif-containing protein [Pseudobdellovibrionaceae bacterium]
IQTIGRAAWNANGTVILYADTITKSIDKAVAETDRRRRIQQDYNEAHGITPVTIKKRIRQGLGDLYDGSVGAAGLANGAGDKVPAKLSGDPARIAGEIDKLREQMRAHSKKLEFEEAAKIRDEIKRLQILDLSLRAGETEKDTERVIGHGLKSD